MPSELINVLDENGNLTGETKPREEIHALALWHGVARIFIFRKEALGIYFLVQKRAIHKEANPGKWDVRTSGHVKAGETPDETALGELKDELGLELTIDNFIKGPVIKDLGHHHVFASTYYIDFKGDIRDLTFNDGEVDEVKWMKAEEIINATKDDPENWGCRVEVPETALAFVTSLS